MVPLHPPLVSNYRHILEVCYIHSVEVDYLFSVYSFIYEINISFQQQFFAYRGRYVSEKHCDMQDQGSMGNWGFGKPLVLLTHVE